ncbi:NTP transferase domain-containing protein [Patescibacteria group bacterium]|nr:NTP transferase domain-containing protein [Patescibacteria group bacterium]
MSLPLVIMAAGRGTRMKELGQTKPKHLIEVSGRPFLAYLLDNVKTAGFTDVYLVIGYKYQTVYDWFKQNNHKYSLKIINQFDRLGEDKYGTLLPLQAVAKELVGQPVMVLNGDNYYTVKDLLRLQNCEQASAIAGVDHDNPEIYGVLVPNQANHLVTIAEKSNEPPSRFINSGLYKFSSAIWPIISQVKISVRGEYEITEAVKLLAKKEPMEVIVLNQSDWMDFGRPADVTAFAEFVKNQEKDIGPSN